MQHHPITCKKQNFNINTQNYESKKKKNPEIQNSDYLNKHGEEAKQLERERAARVEIKTVVRESPLEMGYVFGKRLNSEVWCL